jgi:hypothetical protein
VFLEVGRRIWVVVVKRPFCERWVDEVSGVVLELVVKSGLFVATVNLRGLWWRDW